MPKREWLKWVRIDEFLTTLGNGRVARKQPFGKNRVRGQPTSGCNA